MKGLKMTEKYSVKKIIEFLGEMNLPLGMLFQKLKQSKSLATVTIIITLISKNISNQNENNYEVY